MENRKKRHQQWLQHISWCRIASLESLKHSVIQPIPQEQVSDKILLIWHCQYMFLPQPHYIHCMQQMPKYRSRYRGHTLIILKQHRIHQHYNSSILISRPSSAVFYSQMHEGAEETVCCIKQLKFWNSFDSHSTDKTDSMKANLTTKGMFPSY